MSGTMAVMGGDGRASRHVLKAPSKRLETSVLAEAQQQAPASCTTWVASLQRES